MDGDGREFCALARDASLDHDRELMRITAHDGRTFVVSDVSDQTFNEIVTLVARTANTA